MLLLILLAAPPPPTYAARLAEAVSAHLPAPAASGAPAIRPLVVHVRLDAKGHVAAAKIQTPSGSAAFDAAGLRTVRSTGGLPLPDSKAARLRVLTEGVALELHEKRPTPQIPDALKGPK